MVEIESARKPDCEKRRVSSHIAIVETLADDRDTLRELYLTLFPEGIVFTPKKRGRRTVWELDGVAYVAGYPPENSETAAGAAVSNLAGDPTET